MSTNTISISYSTSSSTFEPWIHMEQELPPVINQYATLEAVYRLWLSASNGQSARALIPDGCPMEFVGDVINIYFYVDVWPSSADLVYILTPSVGTTTDHIVLRKNREFSIFLNNSTSYDFPYYMEDVTYEWESPCYNELGDEIDPPDVTITNLGIQSAINVFGGLRIYGTAVGYKDTIVVSIDKAEVANIDKIKDQQVNLINSYFELKDTIVASWLNLESLTITEQLSLITPQCVTDTLNFCVTTNSGNNPKNNEVLVYYNGCEGNVLWHEFNIPK